MWINSIGVPLMGPPAKPTARSLLGVAWLRVAAAREAYVFGDLPGAQHHAKMATTAASQALALHKGIEYTQSQDPFASACFCREQLGEPVEDLFRRVNDLCYVRLTEEVLNGMQHDAVQSGLTASGEIVALVESSVGA